MYNIDQRYETFKKSEEKFSKRKKILTREDDRDRATYPKIPRASRKLVKRFQRRLLGKTEDSSL